MYQNQEIMKRIVLLPTENPSVIYKRNDLNTYHLGDCVKCDPTDTLRTNYHMYIISDDDNLELGGYHFNTKYGDEPQKTVQRDIDSRKYWEVEDYFISKILLTTDPDLVKDGIQEVPESFLNWFIENPSCEQVEVLSEVKFFDKNGFCVSMICYDTDYEKTIYYINTDKVDEKTNPVEGKFYWVRPFKNDEFEPAKCKYRQGSSKLWFCFTNGSVMEVERVCEFEQLKYNN